VLKGDVKLQLTNYLGGGNLKSMVVGVIRYVLPVLWMTSKENWATATGNTYRNFDKILACGF